MIKIRLERKEKVQKEASNKKEFTTRLALELASVVAIILLLIFVNNAFKMDGLSYQTNRFFALGV